MPFTAEQNAKLETASHELMEAISGKVPDLPTIKAMGMLFNLMSSGIEQVVPDRTDDERKSMIDAAQGAAFVAAISRDESIPPFEYLKRMTSAMFGEPNEAFDAKMRLYSDAIANVKAGVNVTKLDTNGALPTTDEGDE